MWVGDGAIINLNLHLHKSTIDLFKFNLFKSAAPLGLSKWAAKWIIWGKQEMLAISCVLSRRDQEIKAQKNTKQYSSSRLSLLFTSFFIHVFIYIFYIFVLFHFWSNSGSTVNSAHCRRGCNSSRDVQISNQLSASFFLLTLILSDSADFTVGSRFRPHSPKKSHG